MNEIKQQLESTLTISSEDLRDKFESVLKRQKSESTSEDNSGGKGALTRQQSTDSGGSGGSLRRRRGSAKSEEDSAMMLKKEAEAKDKLIDAEKSETGSVKWDVYKHYLKSIGVGLSIATIILNIIFQGFSIGSNIWLSEWSSDTRVVNDTSLRDMYLGVYGAFGIGQGMLLYYCSIFFMCLFKKFKKIVALMLFEDANKKNFVMWL